MQVRSYASMFAKQILIDMNVTASTVAGFQSTQTWCQNNIRVVKMVDDGSWQVCS
jgi:hypothetical protein